MAADIVLADCLVPVDHDYRATRIYGANICFDCENACGDCEWSEIDPITKHPRFAPVRGWTAKEVLLEMSKNGREVTTYRITACPKFKPTSGNATQRHFGAPPRPVIATDVRGEVREFASIGEAAGATGAREQNIIAACKGKIKTTGGCKWRYAE